MRSFIDRDGQLHALRRRIYVQQKCPFRTDNAANVGALLACDHSCPQFSEWSLSDHAQQVTLACSSSTYTVLMDRRTEHLGSGERVSTIELPATGTQNFGQGFNASTLGFLFKTKTSGTATYASIDVAGVQSGATLTAYIYTNSGGSPSAISGGASTSITLGTSDSGVQTFSWTSSAPSLSDATKYWLIIKDTSSQSTGKVLVQTTKNNPAFLFASDGTADMGSDIGDDLSDLSDQSVWELSAEVITAGAALSAAKQITLLDQTVIGVEFWGDGVTECKYIGWMVTPPSSGTVSSTKLRVNKVTAGVNAVCQVYANNSGVPGTQAGGDSTAVGLSATETPQTVKFTWTSSSPTVNGSDPYWVVFKDAGTSGDAEVAVCSNQSSTGSGKDDTVTSVADLGLWDFVAEVNWA